MRSEAHAIHRHVWSSGSVGRYLANHVLLEQGADDGTGELLGVGRESGAGALKVELNDSLAASMLLQQSAVFDHVDGEVRTLDCLDQSGRDGDLRLAAGLLVEDEAVQTLWREKTVNFRGQTLHAAEGDSLAVVERSTEALVELHELVELRWAFVGVALGNAVVDDQGLLFLGEERLLICKETVS